jgi:hypothetical protein
MRWTVASPTGLAQLTVTLDEDGAVWYEAAWRGSGLIAASRLGLEGEEADFASGLALVAPPTPHEVDDRYSLPRGKQRVLRGRATEATVGLRAATGERFDIDLRAYDDAVAVRYRWPDGGDGPARRLVVTAERTEFALAGPGRAWMQPTSPADLGGPAHENLYADGVATGTASPTRSWDLPAVFEVGGRWLLISEAGLDAGYCGMRLAAAPQGHRYTMVGPDPGEGLGVGAAQPTVERPWTGPWRFIAFAEQAAGLVESNVVTHLAAPSRIADPSWVRPGRASWSWWAHPSSPRDLSALRRYIDFAAEMGWEYSLVDANWTVHGDRAMRRLARHADSRGVGLLLWYNSGGPNNAVPEQPRDRMFDRPRRRQEMARIAGWGVAGVKVDFFHSDKQESIARYLGILADAAEARLVVSFHGCTIPRGWERTWPNLLTLEAVRGAEWYQSQPAYAAEAVWHNTVLAFTRAVIGPMDYTPVALTDRVVPRLTTTAHELALTVVFESGIVCFADSPESYRASHPAVLDVLRRVPAAWDQTVGLAGAPGAFAVVGRRAGTRWWVAGVNGPRPRGEMALPLDRLGGVSGPWRLVSDGADRDDLTVADVSSQSGGALIVPPLPAGGGFIAWTLSGE